MHWDNMSHEIVLWLVLTTMLLKSHQRTGVRSCKKGHNEGEIEGILDKMWVSGEYKMQQGMAGRFQIPQQSLVIETKENCCISTGLTGSRCVTCPCTVGQACPPNEFLAKRALHPTPQFQKEMLCVCAGKNLQVNQSSL